MKYRLTALVLAAAVTLALTGCALLEREYSSVEPHSSSYYESEAGNVLRADEAARVTAFPEKPGEPQVSFGNGSMSFQVEIPVHIATEAGRGIPMVMGLELGQDRTPGRSSRHYGRMGSPSAAEYRLPGGG